MEFEEFDNIGREIGKLRKEIPEDKIILRMIEKTVTKKENSI